MVNEKTTVVSGEALSSDKNKLLKNIAIKMGIGVAGMAAGTAIGRVSTAHLANVPATTGPAAHTTTPAHATAPAAIPNAAPTVAGQNPAEHATTLTPAPVALEANQPTHNAVFTGELHECKGVNDNMSFSEAFKTARHEGGPNGFFHWHEKVFDTLYDTESSKLTPEERKQLDIEVEKRYNDGHKHEARQAAGHEAVQEQPHHPVILVYDEAPHSGHVTDDMSLKDAFAVARADVGAGGVFEWHGHNYSTYTSEEFNYMSDEQKHDFTASAGNIHVETPVVSSNEIDILSIDNGSATADTASHNEHPAPVHDDHPAAEAGTNEHFVKDEYVDNGHGGQIHIAVYNIDGHEVYKIDQDNDGKFDMTITHNDDGNFHVHNIATGQDETLTPDDMNHLAEQGNDANADETAHENVPTTGHDYAAADGAEGSHYADTHAGYNYDAHHDAGGYDDRQAADFDPHAHMGSFDVTD